MASRKKKRTAGRPAKGPECREQLNTTIPPALRKRLDGYVVDSDPATRVSAVVESALDEWLAAQGV